MTIRSVSLSDNISEFITEFNAQATDVGDLVLLNTADKSTIVAAINWVFANTATQAEAEAGVVTTKFMTPLRTKQAIDFLRVITSQAEAEAGVENTKQMSALRTKQAIDFQRAFATQAEAEAGVVAGKIVSPLTVKQAVTFQRPFATQAEAEAGVENTKITTSLRTKQAIDFQRPFATQAEAEAGVENTKIMTSLRVAQQRKSRGGYGVRSITTLTSGSLLTFTPNVNTRALIVHILGGGGGGGGVDGQGAGTAAMAGCGGGAVYHKVFITNMAQTFEYTVGDGGAAGFAGANNGFSGGTTTFYCSVDGDYDAGGGGGGDGQVAASDVGANGGNGGSVGSPQSKTVMLAFGQPGSASYCGSVGVLRKIRGPAGGNALYPGHVRPLAADGNGVAATNPGTGGGGASVAANTTNYMGGIGSGGEIRIEELW